MATMLSTLTSGLNIPTSSPRSLPILTLSMFGMRMRDVAGRMAIGISGIDRNRGNKVGTSRKSPGLVGECAARAIVADSTHDTIAPSPEPMPNLAYPCSPTPVAPMGNPVSIPVAESVQNIEPIHLPALKSLLETLSRSHQLIPRPTPVAVRFRNHQVNNRHGRAFGAIFSASNI